MTADADPTSSGLRDLQFIDNQIRRARERIASFEPLLREIEESAEGLAAEAGTTAERVKELHMEERRLRRAAEDKRLRIGTLKDRLDHVRTVRQEAAVKAELGLVERAVESEEREVIHLLDQIGRLEERMAAQQSASEEARAAVEPRKRELVAEQAAVQSELDDLTRRREEVASALDSRFRQVYESLARGGRRQALAPMTEDGACGACFSVIPLQLQNEIRTTAPLVLCEACGIIVTAPESGEEGAAAEAEQGAQPA